MKTKSIAVLIALALIAGIGVTLLVASTWGLPWNTSSAPSAGGESHDGHAHAEGEDDSSYYTCPMHPSVVSETPGACPVCGMDLVKKTKGGSGMDPQELAAMGQVALSPTQRVLANVAVTEVEKRGASGSETASSATEVRSVGVVAADETGLATIPSWVDGRIDRLLIKETGTRVAKGQPVISIYSPELLAAQEEFLVALQSSDKTLAGATKQRLRLLGMSDSQIARLRSSGKASEQVTMTAPNAGTVTGVTVRQGQYVKEGDPLYQIADLSTVWVEAEVYENNLSAIDEGMPVRVTAEAFPGESMQGKVAFIHPTLDPETRTVKVRVVLDNSEDPSKANKLKPGMYTSVYFETGQAKSDAPDAPVELLVPKSAVIRGGKSNSVFVEIDDNVFERRQVEVGQATEKYLVVKSGIKAGEKVAYQGGFLLDSEVQLNSFGGSGGDHAGHGSDSGGKGGSGEAEGEHEQLSAEDIPKEGKEFDPPIPSASVPQGAWFCDMNDTSHWVQHEEGDGSCPVCGMHLKQKEAK
jgi:Cu(I)/Ag(I) efflux system membrane fusion protein